MAEKEGLTLTGVPVVTTSMLIRRPVSEVFEAFIDPAVTTRFWFSRSSGPLVEGEQVRWEWEMFGVGGDVRVRQIEENRRILIDWGSAAEDAWTEVEWLFEPRGNAATFLTITDSGFEGSGDEVCGYAIDSSRGFALVVAGLKAYLEHGIELNLVADHAPEGLVEGWKEQEQNVG